MSEHKVRLLELLHEVLGDYHEFPKNNEVAFFCPKCLHRKKKLQVNLETGKWRCWVCSDDNQMAGVSIFSLFRRIDTSIEYYTQLSNILGTKRKSIETEKYDKSKTLYLPKEFTPLIDGGESFDYKRAIGYLKRRGIGIEDIAKHNIGYSEFGEYDGKVIFPSYDAEGKLNFFVGRAYYENDYEHYKMPSWSKDIVMFEMLINFTQPIVIVEGVFDAIAIRQNAIPLLGKSIPDSLRLKIIEHNTRDIYVALDADALKSSIKHLELFIGEGRNVYFVDLQKKDPSLIGFDNMQRLLWNTKRATSFDIMKLKLR